MGITYPQDATILRDGSEAALGLADFSEKTDRISFSDMSSKSCVGIIDIVGSTKITSVLNRHDMTKFYSLFINWASSVIVAYGGIVVKNTGDGLLFYFPLAEKGDNLKKIRDCLDCSIALAHLHPSINNKFRSESLPGIDYRISLDYGEVTLATISEATIPDIFSVTVNVCAKINRFAAPNTIVVGGDLYQVSKNLRAYSFGEIKKTITIASKAYPIYHLAEPKTIILYTHSVKQKDTAKGPRLPDSCETGGVIV